ncbi:uncharacterized protein KD926_010587 [Aspergillus affinis]|uniref:uncharacterized protein n=1 Tax=Aspergillus affinis TaxID=1070780 RepID=UPI0022FE5BA2|nr:uncharacterized protein KD926_010587 [Aspergillus affinis]KAI9038643.1 hypothetical protein KD926_010587 [Aspergillus affinis]
MAGGRTERCEQSDRAGTIAPNIEGFIFKAGVISDRIKEKDSATCKTPILNPFNMLPFVPHPLPISEDSPFPVTNIPFGIFSTPENPQSRPGVAVGDHVLDLCALAAQGHIQGSEQMGRALSQAGRIAGHPQLPANFFNVPLAYNGRTSSVIVSSSPIHRPYGIRPDSHDGHVKFAPSQKLDYEIELGMFVSNSMSLGQRIPTSKAKEHIFGFVLLNNWTARNIQFYKMMPHEALQEAGAVIPVEKDRIQGGKASLIPFLQAEEDVSLAALRKASNAQDKENQSIDVLSQDSTRKRKRSEPSASHKTPGALSIPVKNSNGTSSAIMQPLGFDATRRISTEENDRDDLPPRALGLSLLEIYFERIYNAPLLFNKHALMKDYLEGRLPEYLLRALFALASIFLESGQISTLPSNEPLELSTLRLFASQGRPWAESASREALSLSGQPSLFTIQALESLTIYWFAAGDNQRADIHLTVAYRSCYNVGYNKLLGWTGDPCRMMRTEIERRCFWACWATMCIAGQPKAYLKSAWLEAAELPLPVPFDQDQSAFCTDHAEKMDACWNCLFLDGAHHDGSLPDSVVLAELLKLIGIWAKTQVLVKQTPEETSITEALNLSAQITALYNLPSFPPLPSIWNDPSASKEHVLLVHSLYHLCQMTLNRAIVPPLCGRRQSQVVPAHIERQCAHAVLDHARLQGRLVLDHLAQSSDVTRISPIVGFTAFSAAVIIALAVRSQDLREVLETPSNMSNDDVTLIQSLTGLVNGLSRYWKTLQRLSIKLRTLVTHLLPAEPGGTELDPDSISNPGVQIRGPPSIETEKSVISSGYVYTSESETEGDSATRSRKAGRSNTHFEASASNNHTYTNKEPELPLNSGLLDDAWQPTGNFDAWEDFTDFVTGDADAEGLETLTVLFPSEWPLY